MKTEGILRISQLFRRRKEKETDSTITGSDNSLPAPQASTQSSVETKRESHEAPVIAPLQTALDSLGLAKTVNADAGGWVPPGSTAVVKGRNIGGMVYLAPKNGQGGRRQMTKPIIDPSRHVASIGEDFSGEGMPYWPGYAEINLQARATYLDWLASGRSDKRYSVGYVFLYFYGLERRFFIDEPDDEEKRLLLAEVERLLLVYGDNGSIRGYLGNFIEAAQATLTSVSETNPYYERVGYDLPLDLRVAIGRMSKESRPISADWLLSWYINSGDYSLRTPAKRAFPEFRAFFTQLFDERFPAGLPLPTSKRTFRARYQAASSEFFADLSKFVGVWPDISRISGPLDVANTIVDEATAALDKYSRFLGRNPNGRGTIEAHGLLPQRLWRLFPCAEVDGLRRWTEDIISDGGLVPVAEVIERLENTHPEKITKRQLTDAADALAHLSVGMAPDPRYALRSPKQGEPVVLFQLPGGVTALEAVSDRYRSILIAVAIGSFIAHADDAFAATERAGLVATIDGGGDLSESEVARLRANLNWMMTVPPDMALFRRHLKDLPDATVQELGQFALALATSDGVISTKEVGALERLYKAMGLEQGGIYAALHALVSRDEPVTVLAPDKSEEGFGIPPRPDAVGSVTLNAERVASVMANTERVSAILAEIFQDDEPEEVPAEVVEPTVADFDGLDAKHAAFLGEILLRSHWEEDEYRTLASQFGLMPAGAIETLNEWSLDHFDDLLIEEGQGYTVNQDIGAEVTAAVR